MGTGGAEKVRVNDKKIEMKEDRERWQKRGGGRENKKESERGKRKEKRVEVRKGVERKGVRV